jgi:hypothetical protein
MIRKLRYQTTLTPGDGSFLPAKSYAAGAFPFDVAVGDFNGDGIPDLAVAEFTGGVRGNWGRCLVVAENN